MNSIKDIIREYGHHNRWKGVRWMNNAQAIGFTLIAAKDEFNFDKQQLQRLEQAMRRAMDRHTEQEAEQIYMEN